MKKLLIIIAVSFLSISTFANTQQLKSVQIQEQLKKLEKEVDGKIGVYAINTNNNQIIAYRADERFPVQSTLKLIGVSALLKESHNNKNLLQEKIHYTKNDLMFWHPITGKYVKDGMTLEALSEAAISYSDNPAINLIMKKLGGPKSITNFAKSFGNKSFNIENYEGDLNSNPKNNKDTSTPKDMAISVQRLTLGNILTMSERDKLVTWMRNNVAGNKRIRSGVPIGWVVADKTGSGDYGVANDIGILWSPLCKPIVLAIYTAGNKKDAKRREDIIASTTSMIMDEFAKNDSCFEELNK
jgi:beta-lactamase class A